MSQSRNNIFLVLTENMFTLTGNACDCMTDIEHLSKTDVKEMLKLKSRPDMPLKFSFAPEKGLVRLSPAGSIVDEHILSGLISLPEGGKKKLEDFFEKNGFFLPISEENLETVDINAVWGVANRVKAAVLLMSELEAPEKDYNKILSLVLYLLMEPPAVIKVLAYEESYTSADHPFSNAYNNTSQIPEANGIKDAFIGDTYQIADTIFVPYYSLKINEYNDIISGASLRTGATQSDFFRNITYLYRNAVDAGEECRLFIDFLFHFQSRVGIIQSWDAQGNLTFFEDAAILSPRYIQEFNDQLKQALIRITKIVIKEELDYNLRGVFPTYDTDTMAPSWYIADLLSALYFSVFYMRPGTELYRRCANTTCNQYFLVKTTANKQKYCSAACGNAAAQRNHRKKAKERSGAQS